MGNKVTLLVGDCPTGIDFGIDCVSYETASKFKGITAIPSGLHLLYFSAGTFQREGYFCNLVDPIYVLQWDKAEERFVFLPNLSRDQIATYQQEILSGSLNSNLAPYPQKNYQAWVRLTSCITSEVLDFSHCTLGNLLAPSYEEEAEKLPLNASIPLFPSLEELFATGIEDYYHRHQHPMPTTKLNMITVSDSNTSTTSSSSSSSSVSASQPSASALTALGMDRSWLLESLAATLPCHTSPSSSTLRNVLGQYQLSFILFLFLQSARGLSYWKGLLLLLVQSHQYWINHPQELDQLIKIIYAQLKYVPDDFFEDEVISRDNFLSHAFQMLFSVLYTIDKPATIVESRHRLAIYLYKKFGWIRLVDGRGQNIDMLTDDQHLDDQDASMMGPVFAPSTATGRDDSAMESDDVWLQPHQDDEAKQRCSASEESKAQRADCGVSPQPSIQFTDKLKSLESSLDAIAGYQASPSHPAAPSPTTTSAGVPPLPASTCPMPSLSGDLMAVLSATLADGGMSPPPQAMDTNDVVSLPDIAAGDREAARYSWRYPLLYDEMQRSGGKEDMIMTAMRVMDLAQELELSQSATFVGGKEALEKLFNESLAFVENEAAVLGGGHPRN